jgi:1-deoxy-D-xylulose-5-phosphate reductoisomerase
MTQGEPKRVAILGSTGSIGGSTLDVVRQWPDRFDVRALAAGGNWESLLAQVIEFRPRIVALRDAGAARALREALSVADAVSSPPPVLEGEEGLREIAGGDGLDLVVNGLVGSLGLLPTLAALESGASVAIANKETLVMAGEPVMAAASRSRGELFPLDSELSAIHQCLRGNPEKAVRRVILTASGGPFRLRSGPDLASVTPEEALAHPTWNMGPKVTVDCATMMNKGLEVIETHFYFDIPFDRIETVVHPQSLVHSMVEFVDQSVMAQISAPDMCLPIQYAMTYPERLPSGVRSLDLVATGSLTFEKPDLERFPCLRLARDAGRTGGTAPAVLNAANEIAVEAFLAREIRFDQIPGVIEHCLERCVGHPEPTLENFLSADGFTREEARRAVRDLRSRAHARGTAS